MLGDNLADWAAEQQAEAEARGKAEGKAEGTELGRIETVRGLVASGVLTVDKAREGIAGMIADGLISAEVGQAVLDQLG